MPLEVKRKQREPNQSLVFRFMKRFKQSGVLLRYREARFFERAKSDEAQKRTALRRVELKKKYDELKKIGKK
jgi:hypothetical protein